MENLLQLLIFAPYFQKVSGIATITKQAKPNTVLAQSVSNALYMGDAHNGKEQEMILRHTT